MLWSDFLSPLLFLSAAVAAANAFGSYNPNPNRFSLYKSGNHCAYVVEKSVSYTIQDGVAPFVKAEYNKCTWSKKCPKLKYRMFYKPMYKVIHKTMTELEWRCCPGFTGVGCNSSTVQHPEAEPVPEAQAPSGDSETNPGKAYQNPPLYSAAAERLNRMEEDVQRLSLGLETLRGKVTGLEDHLRTSLREDANRMLSALLSAAPAPATAQHSTVAFGDLPGAAPDIEGMEMVGQFPKLGELAEKVEELRTELLSKTTELAELRGTVLRNNGTLQRLTGGAANLTGAQQPLETLVEAKLGETRVAILEGFERRVESVEDRLMGRATEVRLQCKKEVMEGQEHLQQVLNSSFADLRKEFMRFNGQLQGFEPGNQEVCCSAVSGLTERLVLVEDSMDGLNQSQLHLRAELGSHKDHVEGMIEGRLGYVEDKLNKAEMQLGDVGSETSVKLEASLLEGQQLSLLELLCTSSCAPQPVLTGFVAPLQTPEVELKGDHQNLNGHLDAQTERMDRLNATLNSLLVHLSEKKEETGIEGELTLLKVNVHSVNRTLCGLKDTFGQVMQEMEHANLTWQDREERLAQQVKGVVQLVGRQASMLGTGERRLTRLKGELQDLRRRLAAELQGCRSTALGVQKEVTEVGGRVSRVEGQCGGLARLAEDLELIRGELDKQSDGYLSQVNTTLINHSLQISELKNGLKNCTGSSGLAQNVPGTCV
uniref:Elastin microfibril interfacer 3a n=1 Tax=Astyanax mexicanus TaxID=7994 RepID=A0A8B9RL49_ASTMX